jgi:hypothetical protein
MVDIIGLYLPQHFFTAKKIDIASGKKPHKLVSISTDIWMTTKAFVQPQEKAYTSTVAIAGLIHLPQQFIAMTKN